MHAPHHVPKEWADKYKGKFDDGWEAYREKVFKRQKELGIVPADAELSRHDPDVPTWSSRSPDERKVYARMMEVFAGYLSHTDSHIARLLDFLKSIGQFENTLIMVLSDNGASPEGGPTGSLNENLFMNMIPESIEENLKAIDDIGGPKTYNHYPWGWTWAGNTPFRRWKRETYRGGICDPFIVHWPKGIKAKGEVRTQYAHAIDMVPTVLEALGINPPTTIRGVTQSPLEGVSFTHTFNSATAPSKHITQYFEMFGHRSIYNDGWRAVCPWPGLSYVESGRSLGAPISAETLTELDAKHWELYNVTKDFAENHNVAAENRDKVIEMVATWYVEAGKYKVLPIDGRVQMRAAEERPTIAPPRTSYTFYPNTQKIPAFAVANVLNRSHSITADVEIPEKGAEGVLFCSGGMEGGFTLYVKDDKLHYVHNLVARTFYHIQSSEKVPKGRHKLRYEFEVTGKPDFQKGKGAPGRGQLYFDNRLIGQLEMPVTTPLAFGLGANGATCGTNRDSPVTPEYKTPFTFTSTIYSVIVDVSGELIVDSELEMQRIMRRQ